MAPVAAAAIVLLRAGAPGVETRIRDTRLDAAADGDARAGARVVLQVRGGDGSRVMSFIVAAVSRLAAAAAIGMVVMLVQRRSKQGAALSRPMEQAHVLLCLAGALM